MDDACNAACCQKVAAAAAAADLQPFVMVATLSWL